MPVRKTDPTQPIARKDDTRRRVLDAAERLLRSERAEFAMRDLAAEAGVSFATPFNQFGSKGAIMQALSARRIDAMINRLRQVELGADTAVRVLAAVDVAAAVMLAEPEVNRGVMGTLGAPGNGPGQVFDRSRTLWRTALGDGEGLAPETADLARCILPRQLALAFRGVLSFWTAGEIDDAALPRRAREAACISLLAFVDPARRTDLVAELGGARADG